ncbi:MAG TPA: right-handed parallel beta-helix repeat-containing protein [Blastocatellia bacterium]|nr:right-handed parallel beta-helix repeat-containing protein [Blastocatellia bacterium]
MKRFAFLLVSLLLLAALGPSAFGQSLPARTFVSGNGLDNNVCSQNDPCSTFGAAIAVTAPGGEVVALDSAIYKQFQINQAVSIVAEPGAYPVISFSTGDGIDVNAGVAVVLRGLSINSQGSTGSGIALNTGGWLHVENCVINGNSSLNGVGIQVNAHGTLEVKDSFVRGNLTGIVVSPASGTATASLDHVRIEGNRGGALLAMGGSQVVIRDSVASSNGRGLAAISQNGSPAELSIENCLSSQNIEGVYVQSTSSGLATVRVSNSILVDNLYGFNNAGGTAQILSRGNNTVEGNGPDQGPAIGSYSAR